MTKNKVLFTLVVMGLLVMGVGPKEASAQESQVSFPVAELGNCVSKEQCRTYCEKSENIPACIKFAQKNKLMSQHEVQMAETIMKNGGPGGCKSREECVDFCNDIDNIDKCISFAEKNGITQGEEIVEAKKIQAALKRGIKMPPCKNKQECESYCSNPDNMEMCMNFAIEAGLVPEGTREEMQKMRRALEKGVKPPACRGKKECEEFCTKDENLAQCVSFAEAAGFMTPEQADRTRKTGGKGPGGCRGSECESFCKNPDNREVCSKYSEENGLLSPQDQERMKEGRQKMNGMLNQAPSEVSDCVKAKLGSDKFERMKSGENVFSEGNEFRDCFDGYMRQRIESGERGEGEDRRGERDDRSSERRMQPPPESFRRPPQEIREPQASLRNYLTATIFNADSKFIELLGR